MKEHIRGEISIFLSCIFYSITAILVKYISNDFSGLFISIFRYAVGIITGTALLLIMKQPLRIYDLKTWVIRGVIGSIAMICYFISIQINSSGRATLLFYTYPVFVTLFSFLFFHEPINWRNILSLLLCIPGVFLIFNDKSQYHLSGDITGLIGGLLAGITVHYVKSSTEKNNAIIVYLAACFFGILFLPFTYHEISRLSVTSVLFLSILGVLAFTGQTFMTYGYKFISATKGSIISYSTIPLTILLSYIIGEELKTRFFIGIIFILSGLIISRNNK